MDYKELYKDWLENPYFDENTKAELKAIEQDDNVFILPGVPKACQVETYEDHRVAMAFSLVGTMVDGIEIKNPACTRKTFEKYFDVLEKSIY